MVQLSSMEKIKEQEDKRNVKRHKDQKGSLSIKRGLNPRTGSSSTLKRNTLKTRYFYVRVVKE